MEDGRQLRLHGKAGFNNRMSYGTWRMVSSSEGEASFNNRRRGWKQESFAVGGEWREGARTKEGSEATITLHGDQPSAMDAVYLLSASPFPCEAMAHAFLGRALFEHGSDSTCFHKTISHLVPVLHGYRTRTRPSNGASSTREEKPQKEHLRKTECDRHVDLWAHSITCLT